MTGNGDLFAPLTNLFNQAAVSLSGAFGLAYATQCDARNSERSDRTGRRSMMLYEGSAVRLPPTRLGGLWLAH
jgi:hypothetical protein